MATKQTLTLREVSAERDRQHEKFGDQSGMGHLFMAAKLTALVGGVAEFIATGTEQDEFRAEALRCARHELIQVAAVAVQIIEHIDAEGDG